MRESKAWSMRFVLSLLAVFMIAGGGCGGGGGSDGGLNAGLGTGAGGLGRGPAMVNLGMAGDYVILAKSASSSVPTSVVTGNIGLSPSAASFITGYSLVVDGSGTFATSAQVNGHIFAADYTVPTPANLTTAVLNMEAAYTDAAGRAPDYTELGAGNIGGLTLPPAVYKWGTGVLIPTDVTLAGGPNDVWIFQIAQNLTLSSATRIILLGGVKSENVFWQVFGAVELGTTSHFEGVILSQTSIVVNTGASANGRFLAQTAVTLDSNIVTQP
ncbi:MAG TPA: ice-binding family protein [Planctomycetota bacterium]|jgi:ice-binding like protein|nr:ice-binding family protein [Planctomycetota bacterium]